jgi:hypothetical protein
MADRTTVDCGVFPTMILEARPEARVFSAACPLLEPLSDEGWAKKPLIRLRIVPNNKIQATNSNDTTLVQSKSDLRADFQDHI